MSLLDEIRIAQRDAGEAAVIANLERIGLVTGQPKPRRSDCKDFDTRGMLASKLTCWHRLTEQESDELVALFKEQP